MAVVVPSHKGPIQLHYNAGQVVVTPEDQDRFVMGSCEVVSACQGAIARDRIANQFRDDFLAHVHGWCIEQGHRVAQCYVPFGAYGACIKVFVVRRSGQFDFALSDAIADLESELDRAGWPCDILQVAAGTAEELRAFFDPEHSIRVV